MQNYFGLLDHPVDYYYGPFQNNSICKVSATSFGSCGEATLDIQYLMGLTQNIPTEFYYDVTQDGSLVSFVNQLATIQNLSDVYSISYGGNENQVSSSALKTFNTEAIKLGLLGVTLVVSSGDDGCPGYTVTTAAGCGYFPQFPASSPYVITVGATQDNLNLNNKPEIAASRLTGCGITTGGGFSKVYPASSFQQTAIASYFTKYTPPVSTVQPYSLTGRGYPDVSMPGNNVQIVLNNQWGGVDGTSASAPMFAGMVSLVNAYRKNIGKSTVGWMNPGIYQANGYFTNDVISGSNQCTRGVCCTTARFNCTKGWVSYYQSFH